MTLGGRALRDLNITHDQRQPVADFTISLPQSVDVCTLHVRISAGNSAGMSAPSEPVGHNSIGYSILNIKISRRCVEMVCQKVCMLSTDDSIKTMVNIY